MDVSTDTQVCSFGPKNFVSSIPDARTMTAYLKYLRNERIRPKLEAERDAHLGPGGPANAKKGTVDVHRGGILSYHSHNPAQALSLIHLSN